MMIQLKLPVKLVFKLIIIKEMNKLILKSFIIKKKEETYLRVLRKLQRDLKETQCYLKLMNKHHSLMVFLVLMKITETIQMTLGFLMFFM